MSNHNQLYIIGIVSIFAIVVITLCVTIVYHPVSGTDSVGKAYASILGQNIIINNGFESGTMGWNEWSNGSASWTVAQSGLSGSKALQYSIISDPSSRGSNIQIYQQGLNLEPNTAYRLSFYIKSNRNNNIDAYIHKHGAPYTNYGLDIRGINVGTVWTYIQRDFTTAGFSSNVNDARLRFWFAPYARAGDIYWIDNVSLQKITTSSSIDADTTAPTVSITAASLGSGSSNTLTGHLTASARDSLPTDNPSKPDLTKTMTGITGLAYNPNLAGPTANYPRPSRVPANNPMWKAGYLDATLYGADPTGIRDSTTAIQAALNDGYENILPVYLPSGTYLVSDTLLGNQKPGWVQNFAGCAEANWNYPMGSGQGFYKSYGIVGAKGSSRPIIKLSSNSAGFNDQNNPKAVIHFRNINDVKLDDDGDPNTKGLNYNTWQGDWDCGFYFIVHGIDIDLGSGNSGAIGVQVPSAQYSTVEDVKVNAAGAYAGFRGVTTTNVMVNLEVNGGRYGLISDEASEMTVAGLKLSGQTEAGVLGKSGVITLVGFDITQPANGNVIKLQSCCSQGDAFSMYDGIIRVTNPSVALIDNTVHQENVYLGNVYTSGGGVLINNKVSSRSTNPGWQRINEYAYTDPSTATGTLNTQSVIVESQKLIDGQLTKAERYNAVAGLPPTDLIARHTWPEIPWFTDADAKWVTDTDIGAKGDAKTDDANAIQYAIDHYEKVFLPRGNYMISKPLVMHANTKLFGVTGQHSILNPTFTPTNGEQIHVIKTDQAADGTAYLGDISVDLQAGYAKSSLGAIDWRVGRKSIIRQFSVNIEWEPDSQTNSLPRSFVEVENTGGGRIYGYTPMLGSRKINDNAYPLLVANTNEPLTLYGPNWEGATGGTNFLLSNAHNFRIFGSKSEPGGGTNLGKCVNSDNIMWLGSNGHTTWSQDPLLDFTNCNNVLFGNILVYTGMHAVQYGDMVHEVFNGNTYRILGKDQINLFRRGNFDANIFNNITPVSNSVTPTPICNNNGVCEADETTANCPTDCKSINPPPQNLAGYYRFTATASDASGLYLIRIYVNNANVKTCITSPCIYDGGPYNTSSLVTYWALAMDKSPNRNIGRSPASGAKYFRIS